MVQSNDQVYALTVKDWKSMHALYEKLIGMLRVPSTRKCPRNWIQVNDKVWEDEKEQCRSSCVQSVEGFARARAKLRNDNARVLYDDILSAGSRLERIWNLKIRVIESGEELAKRVARISTNAKKGPKEIDQPRSKHGIRILLAYEDSIPNTLYLLRSSMIFPLEEICCFKILLNARVFGCNTATLGDLAEPKLWDKLPSEVQDMIWDIVLSETHQASRHTLSGENGRSRWRHAKVSRSLSPILHVCTRSRARANVRFTEYGLEHKQIWSCGFSSASKYGKSLKEETLPKSKKASDLLKI
ncbi:hypothetical protein BDZ45DRAFT_741737 [Acephala macrosclerotiorum]|nr:hypothetical protein BDZ45DRAFT_741737 [Acephala macrosclerotiorum]